MPYPKEFFYNETHSSVSYVDTPTGTPDIGRLIHGQPYWVMPSQTRKPKPKKLIIANWLAWRWSEEKWLKVQAVLQQLIRDGFTLYFTENEHLVTLREDELGHLSSFMVGQATRPEYYKQITKRALRQERLPAEQIHILDDYWLEQLLYKEKAWPTRSLRLSDLPEKFKDQKAVLDFIIDILLQSSPPLYHIIHDIFSTKENECIDYIHKKFPYLNIVRTFQRVKFEDNEAESLIREGSLTNVNTTITLDDLRSVRFLGLIEHVNPVDVLQAILEINSKIHTLHLENSDFSSSLRIPAHSLSNLESLVVRTCLLNEGIMLSLLAAASKLKTLNLYEINLLTDFPEITASLPLLERIKLNLLAINAKTFSTLLAMAPALKTLDLSCVGIGGEGFFLRAESLGSLEHLYLKKTILAASYLRQLLMAAPRLKALYLANAKDEEGNDLPVIPDSRDERTLIEMVCSEEVSLPHLEVLDIDASTVPPMHLQSILMRASQLKKIRLTSCILGPIGLLSLEANSLPLLECLDVTESIFPVVNLQKLLLAAPQLRQLDLGSCHGRLFLPPRSLLSLNVLNLTECSLHPLSLQNLLEAAPNIEKLKFAGYLDIDKPFNLQVNSLPMLRDLTLTGIDFERERTNHNLQQLLAAAPNVQKLYMWNCKGLFEYEGSMGNTSIYFPHLKIISLDESHVTAECLKKLLKAAPDLKELYLENVRGLEIDEELQELLSRIPYVILSHNTSKQVSNTSHEIQHHAADTKDFIPAAQDRPFKFKGKNDSKNQEMIIEKLSQYLTLSGKHLAAIPRMQDGICNALVHYFINHTERQWEEFLNRVNCWDGKEDTLADSLSADFTALYAYVEKYQFSYNNKHHYLCDNLPLFLDVCHTPCILGNPWHSIAIRPKADGLWDIYDPNFREGVQVVDKTQLLIAIHRSIGQIVYVKSSEEALPPCRLDNPGKFIEEGGLLALSSCDDIGPLLSHISPTMHYSKENLEGLLLRDIKGLPAWVRGFHHASLLNFTQILLQQFIHQHAGDFKEQLQQSLAALSPQQRQECIALITQNCPVSPMRDLLIALLRTTSTAVQHYERQLQTWESKISPIETLDAYCRQCIAPSDIKKRLIKLTSTSEVNALQWALQRYAKATHRPLFYIHSPKDFVCSASYVERRADGRGIVRKGPGGPLYDFLKARRAGEAPLLIVNYESFNADDIARFNGLLDVEGHADGTRLPIDAMVIGLINMDKPDCYQGSDFYSRFDQVERYPLPQASLLQTLPTLPISEKAADTPPSPNVINLYHSLDWKTRLLGRFILKGKELIFEQGELAHAIERGGPIEIQNGLWNDEDFQQFWQQAFLNGSVDHGHIAIPRALKLIKSEGYDWEVLKPYLRTEAGELSDAIILNPSRVGEFFNHYACEHQMLVTQDGYIKTFAGKTLPVYLTRSLNADDWAMILHACKRYDVHLNVRLAAGVTLPNALKDSSVEPLISLESSTWDKAKAAHGTHIVTSTDIDTTVAELTSGDKPWVVIDVSECRPSDLLRRIDGKLLTESDPPTFQFTEQISLLLAALDSGKPVILKGSFSEALADELATLLLARQKEVTPASALVLVSDDVQFFNYVPIASHVVEASAKVALLEPMTPDLRAKLEPFIAQESLSQLQARRVFLQMHPDKINSDAAWEGLSRITNGIAPQAEFDIATSEVQTIAFSESRLQSVNKALEHGPYVFLTGFTGTGKSTFVKEELCRPEDSLYIGENTILTWANDKRVTGRKILFIDEANLSERQWSEFEGMFQTPPSIRIQGKLHPLSPEHKVIFAGNPLTYGDERQLAPFFKRHGSAVMFTPLPAAVLYEKGLKPIFEGTALTAEAPVLCAHILKIYDFLRACSTTEVLISARELQMIALLTAAYHQRHPDIAPMNITTHIAYQLATHLVPKEKRLEFDERFKPVHVLPADSSVTPGFTVTPSRHIVKQYIDDCLSLRELRQRRTGNEAQQYGGLGGIVLEGEPGAGKSELVIATLIARGYKEVHDITTPAACPHPFYRVPVSMSLPEKEMLLRKAFDEGAIVVIDEINSSPMMERLLNDLLMGKTPENTRPSRPGFMVIGTQNPISMGGRRLSSHALSRRLMTMEFLPYTTEEMKTILLTKGLTEITAETLVKAYQKQVSFAKMRHLNPLPTFRDLLKLAQRVLSSERALMSAGEVLPSTSYVKINHTLSDLITTYFGVSDDHRDGIFSRAQSEIDRAYWFQELTAQYAAMFLGYAQYQSMSMQRKEYLHELREAVRKYQADPALYEEVCKLLRSGQELYLPLSKEDSSFHATLNDFGHELSEIHARIASVNTAAALRC